MTSNSLQILLMKIVLLLFGILFLLQLIRFIKIFFTKKIKNKNDFFLILFFTVFTLPFILCYYRFKRRLTKDKSEENKNND